MNLFPDVFVKMRKTTAAWFSYKMTKKPPKQQELLFKRTGLGKLQLAK